MIEIRVACAEDIPAIARVHAQADWETYAPLFGPQAYALDVADLEHRWRQALADGSVLLVAADRGAIVGLGHACAERIGALYLLAAYRRQGIGRGMLSRLLHAMHQRGMAEAQFDVVAINADAIAFYRAQGARPIGRATHSDARGQVEDLIFAIATAPLASTSGFGT